MTCSSLPGSNRRLRQNAPNFAIQNPLERILDENDLGKQPEKTQSRRGRA
jgi:hypothetical protein